MCDLFILIYLILFLKDYGLAINIFACSIQINTFNSLLKKKKKLLSFFVSDRIHHSLICWFNDLQ